MRLKGLFLFVSYVLILWRRDRIRGMVEIFNGFKSFYLDIVNKLLGKVSRRFKVNGMGKIFCL